MPSDSRASTLASIARWTAERSIIVGASGTKPFHIAISSSTSSIQAGTSGVSPLASEIATVNELSPNIAGVGPGPMTMPASGSSKPTVPSRYLPSHPARLTESVVPVHHRSIDVKCERSGFGMPTPSTMATSPAPYIPASSGRFGWSPISPSRSIGLSIRVERRRS